MPSPTRPLLLALALAACDPAPKATPDAAPPPAPDAGVDPRVARANRLRGLFAAVNDRMGQKDWDGARDLLAKARAEASDDAGLLERISSAEAIVHAYRGDFAAAASVLTQHLRDFPPAPDQPTAFHFNNTLLMIHTAAGDLPAALAACDAMTAAGQNNTWATSEDARRFVMLKEHWHRAYLLRMVAAREAGAKKSEAMRGAEQARKAYKDLAAPLGTYGDAIAVLDGFFAVHAGDKKAALAAGKKVDLEKNDDLEDLYLAQMALDAGGDKAGAEKVRTRIEELKHVSLAHAVVATWIRRDLATAKGEPPRWSPRHPTGAI